MNLWLTLGGITGMILNNEAVKNLEKIVFALDTTFNFFKHNTSNSIIADLVEGLNFDNDRSSPAPTIKIVYGAQSIVIPLEWFERLKKHLGAVIKHPLTVDVFIIDLEKNTSSGQTNNYIEP